MIPLNFISAPIQGKTYRGCFQGIRPFKNGRPSIRARRRIPRHRHQHRLDSQLTSPETGSVNLNSFLTFPIREWVTWSRGRVCHHTTTAARDYNNINKFHSRATRAGAAGRWRTLESKHGFFRTKIVSMFFFASKTF